MSDLEERVADIARKFAIKNAVDYGVARSDTVINKIFLELPSAKEIGMVNVRSIVDGVVGEINSMSKDELEKEYKMYTFLEQKQRVGLPDLGWADQNTHVNTRFAPNPSGYLHIGHAKIAILCDEYSKRYKGKFFVRFEDTDPRTKRPIVAAYQSIIDDLEWLGCDIGGVFKQSERLPIYYSFAERLLKDGNAYVCLCAKEEMQENRRAGRGCRCRDADPATNIANWKRMFTDFREGEASLRLKTDMSHPNTSIRDWIMFRIIDDEHPLTGKVYRVWPLYNFASAIDDHEMGINLIIRGKEHEINGLKQAYVYDYFGWELPHIMEVGILKVEGTLAHKSDIIRAIKSGELRGWDDPRAPTVAGFRSKSMSPEAIREYVVGSGIGKNDSYLDVKKLDSINRKYLASKEHRASDSR